MGEAFLLKSTAIMKIEDLKKRIESLTAVDANGAPTTEGHELIAGTLSLLTGVYGVRSVQVENLQSELSFLRGKSHFGVYGSRVALSSLRMLKDELEGDLVSNIERSMSGEILTDFLQLSREALSSGTEGSKNVAAVLAAALYEDTIRRLARVSGTAHEDKLETVIGELKKASVIQGATVGVATSYLSFRNKALHADWENVDRPEVNSALAFVEELLLKHFSA